MNTVLGIALAGLAVAGAMILVRMVRGPTSSDRIVALDTLLLVVVAAVAVQVARLENRSYVGVLVVVSVLAFVGDRGRGPVPGAAGERPVTVVLDVAASVLLLTGVALALLAGVGMLRFPDVLMRMHAQTKPAVLGLLLVLAGTGLAARDVGLGATLVLVAVFQLVTAPVGAHMIARSAYVAEHVDRARLVRDDLAHHDPERDEVPSPDGEDPQHGEGCASG